MSKKIENIKTVGDLKKALDGVEDSLLLDMTVSGYDDESEEVVSICNTAASLTLELVIAPTKVCISNASYSDMEYIPY